jgi:hypothetical protein
MARTLLEQLERELCALRNEKLAAGKMMEMIDEDPLDELTKFQGTVAFTLEEWREIHWK